MVWNRAYGSWKLRCNMCKRFSNITSKTIYWSDFAVCDAVEVAQELHKVPEQVTYKRHTCMAGIPVEKL